MTSHKNSHPRHFDGALFLLLLLALALRLCSSWHGLPFVYHFDEDLHFVAPAVQMLRGSLNPHYFKNPPALTYLFCGIFRIYCWASGTPVRLFIQNYNADPSLAFLTGRIVVALLGSWCVGEIYRLTRAFHNRASALMAAALMALAPLPVWYAHLALNDAAVLLPVTIAMHHASRALKSGRLSDWCIGGAAAGVAAATKYTAGLVALGFIVAAFLRWRQQRRAPLKHMLQLVCAGFVAIAVFLMLNPYAIIDNTQFLDDITAQITIAKSLPKLGEEQIPGYIYYAWTLSWGWGWLPLFTALIGIAAGWRHKRAASCVLLVFPLFLFAFLGHQAEYFSRWLMPIYPALCVFSAYGAQQAWRFVPALRIPAITGVALAALFAQQTMTDLHSAIIMSRDYTWTEARDWLLRSLPAQTKISIEPFVPEYFFNHSGELKFVANVWMDMPYVGKLRQLAPQRIDNYRKNHTCWLVISSQQKGRIEQAQLPGAIGYYQRLDAESDQTIVFSPFREGETVPFNFDWTFDYLPLGYIRPGPLVEIHHVKDCAEE